MIEIYSHDQHYNLLRSWLAAHDIIVPPKDLFSDIGLCVNRKAIGFLFLTNSPQAYMDNIAADPKIDKSLRDSNLRVLTDALTAIAQQKGVKILNTLTSLATMKERLYDMNFKRLPDNYAFYTKFLSQGGI